MQDMFNENKNPMKLYVKRVFISDKFEDQLLPRWRSRPVTAPPRAPHAQRTTTAAPAPAPNSAQSKPSILEEHYAVPYFFAGSSPGLSWETIDAGYGCIVGGRRYEDAPAKKNSPEKLKMCSNDVILNV